MSDPDDAEAVEGTHIPAIATARARRVRVDLASVRDCRRELARCIREARAGLMSTADLTRFSYSLLTLAKLAELSEFEQRIAALEDEDERSSETPATH